MQRPPEQVEDYSCNWFCRTASLVGMFEIEDIHNYPAPDSDLWSTTNSHAAVDVFENGEKCMIMGRNELSNRNYSAKTGKEFATNPVINEWFNAVSSGDTEKARTLCENKFPVNTVEEHGRTALHFTAELKNEGLLAVLTKFGADVNLSDNNGMTPLHIAARANDLKSVQCLLTAGASVTAIACDGTTPLHCCCQTGDGCDVATALLHSADSSKESSRKTKQGVSGVTVLHDATEAGDVRTVKLLLDHSVDVNATTSYGMTPLHLAAKHGFIDVATCLISKGARLEIAAVDSKGSGVVAVHLAAEFNHSDMVNALVASGADVKICRVYSGRGGVTCLHLAAMKRNLDMIRTLLDEHNVNVNSQDAEGATALHLSARAGFTDVAQLLLKRGAGVDIGMSSGQSYDQTALHCAVRCKHPELARLLVRSGANINATEKMTSTKVTAGNSAGVGGGQGETAVSGYTALHWAVENGDLDMVCILLDNDADPNITASFDRHSGVTALHLASQDGYSAIAQELLRVPGCARDPLKRTENRDNITPLHQAVYNGHVDTARVLIEGGCDINRQADNGYSALHYAAQQGNVQLTRLMLKRGGDVRLVATAGDQLHITCLHLAVQSGSTDVVRALVDAGAEVDACKTMGSVSGVTALHQAVYQEKYEVVKTLLECGANVNASMGGWYTPLHIAAEKGSTVIAGELLKFDANVNIRAKLQEHSGLSPLHVAAQHGHYELISLFVLAGADLQAVRTFSERLSITALHLASENGFTETVEALIDVGADLNARDSLGFTALHLAIQYGFPNIVRLLISSGCNTRIKTHVGLSARKMARQSGNVDLLNIFCEEKKKSSSKKSVKNEQCEIAVGKTKKKKKHSQFMSLLCGIHKS